MQDLNQTLERATMRRVYWRLIPLLFVGMFFNYLDRINIGFAALKMNHDLGLTPAVFGFGASVFFFGYMLLGVPSNLMLERVGARLWIPVILIFWGLIATLTAFVKGALSFDALRFLLGVAEAGALPGFALYVTYWFPSAYRAQAIAGYIIAGQAAAVFGSPIAAALIGVTHHLFGLHGWQWMFVMEGLPTVLLGIAFLVLLTDRPADARWLSPEQRTWLQRRLDDERAASEGVRKFRLVEAVSDGRVWALSILFGCALVGVYGLLIWLPQIINAMGHLSLIEIGLLAAIPPLLGVVGQLGISYSSDRSGERKKHLAFVYLLACVALAASAVSPNVTLAYVLLCVAGLGIFAGNPLFWSISSEMMTGTAGAIAIAFINSIAQFGGLIGPWMIGWVKSSTGSFSDALLAISAFLLVASIIALRLRIVPTVRTAGKTAPAQV
ncbi:MFS transporter [Acidiphilium acidophilum]|nr:MFS transporter [Acidiphilium acidophilum]